MSANDVLDTAAAFPDARVAAVHTEGWAHVTESFEILEQAFATLGMERVSKCVRPSRSR